MAIYRLSFYLFVIYNDLYLIRNKPSSVAEDIDVEMPELPDQSALGFGEAPIKYRRTRTNGWARYSTPRRSTYATRST